MLLKGCEMMNYQKLLKQVAEHFNTTPAEVEKEMKIAIALSGHEMSPEEFIKMCVSKVK